MINNETMQSILARRSYKMFDSKPIGDEELDTIITAGLYAATGLNTQPWHFTVIKSKEGLEKFGEARRSLPLPPGVPEAIKKADPMRNAPVMIIVSAKNAPTAAQDSVLAIGNMFIAAASLGIMSGWDHATVMNLFQAHPELKAEYVPEGNTVYAAAFFGYPGPDVKDRGERKGTVSYL